MPKADILKGGGVLNSMKSAMAKASSASSTVGQKAAAFAAAPAISVNSLKQAATNKVAGAAVNAAVKDVPGGTAAVGILGTLGISKTQMATFAQQGYSSTPSILEKIKIWFANPANANIIIVMGGLFIFIVALIAIGVGAYFYNKSSSNFQNVETQAGVSTANAQIIADSLGTAGGMSETAKKKAAPLPSSTAAIKEKFENPKPETTPGQDDIRLVNLQPLTIKQAGYVGPLRSGVFSERDGVQQSLRAGFRTFILQIDYHEDSTKQPPSYPVKGEPCLLYRDDAGVLTSINAGSIRKTAEAIADLAFQPTLSAKYDPIILILHGLRAPDSVTNPRGYLDYCSKIASQLKPLAPFHLGLTSEGDYHRQALAGQLFTSTFSKFEKKVIILSTFDTTLFRTVDKLGMNPFSPVDDLDYWVNAQLYKEDEKNELGVATVAPINTPLRSSIVDLNRILALSEQEKKAWAVRNRDTFTVALPSQNANPKKEVCDTALLTLGMNVIPLDIFSSPIEETRDLVRSWDKKTWNLKPLALRATLAKGKK